MAEFETKRQPEIWKRFVVRKTTIFFLIVVVKDIAVQNNNIFFISHLAYPLKNWMMNLGQKIKSIVNTLFRRQKQ